MLFQPYIVIYQNVQGRSAVGWPPLCTKSKCFISSQNFFTLWPGKLHMISDRDIWKSPFEYPESMGSTNIAKEP